MSEHDTDNLDDTKSDVPVFGSSDARPRMEISTVRHDESSSVSEEVVSELPEDSMSSFQGTSKEQDRMMLELTAKLSEKDITPPVPQESQSLGKRRDTTEKEMPVDKPLVNPESVARMEYSMRRLLGKGGFAEVWESEQTSLKRRVALKKLRHDIDERVKKARGEGVNAQTAFILEALITASLEHPNILPVYDLSFTDLEEPLLAMKLIRGFSWNRQIKRDISKQTPVRLFLDKHLPILVDVSLAAAFAHSKGIVHRDIKPTQVLLGSYGEVLLTDWGLAMAYDTDLVEDTISRDLAEVAPNKNNAVNPAGTPSFMAPEQTSDTCSDIGPWTDVYLLGGVLYYLLTGGTPHYGPTSKDTFQHAIEGKLDPVRERAGNRFVPEELVELAEEALVPDIKKRLPSATEFHERLRDYLTGASRRQRSIVITEELEGRISQLPSEYGEINKLISSSDTALHLWPDNYSAKQIRQKLVERMCNIALEHNDLVLANTHADRLDDQAARERVADEIEMRLRFDSSKETRRRFFIRGLIVLLVITSAGCIYFLQRSIKAEERIQDAETRQFEAEKMLNEHLRSEKVSPEDFWKPVLDAKEAENLEE